MLAYSDHMPQNRHILRVRVCVCVWGRGRQRRQRERQLGEKVIHIWKGKRTQRWATERGHIYECIAGERRGKRERDTHSLSVTYT